MRGGRRSQLMVSVSRMVPRRLLTYIAVLTAALATAGVSWSTTYNPTTDPYSMAGISASAGATTWWNAGYTGKGVDVAVIDTGVSPVAGLDGSGKVVYG